ncbi:hypothetical protein N7466_010203 [Penicillium verhagenii]|uniref:uncharacterized protein n=1 Tax=Penicillium verhagenii TaxID=1562060 RepID=UPI002545484E|nr:uncharacterized protein N7466_010203 [Penicillium verhagenii]KAJ5919260.1 hypothetical protein N7466_010203 [Penicillium verhagenii]
MKFHDDASQSEDIMSRQSVPESDLMEEGLGGLFEAVPRRVRDGRSFSRIWADMVRRGRFRKPVESVETSVLSDESEEDEVPGKVIVKQMAPRQALAVDLNQIFRSTGPAVEFGTRLSETKSTKAVIREVLDMEQKPVGILGPLLEIIRRDTLTLLQHLRRVLDEVEVDILDDTKMEDRLGLWRQIINRAQRELPELKASLGPLYEFMVEVDPPTTSPGRLAELGTSTRKYQLLPNDIDQMIERLKATSASLTSNMGLLESRRSIDEAHAVTRLTELAFIFIPLSFSTSVFGMQIEPFTNPVPIWNFFVVAISVTAFSYLMRMTMRSQWVSRLKTVVKYDVRKYAEKHGQPVQSRSLPMFLIFQWFANLLGSSVITGVKWTLSQCVWLGQKLWLLFGFAVQFVLVIGVVSGIPIAVVCSRDLEAGIKLPVSLAMVVLAFFFAGVPFWLKSDSEFRDALPTLFLEGISNIPGWVFSILMVLVGITILVGVPLILIWTRSLDVGIKGGLTAGILIMVILTLGAFGVSMIGGTRNSRTRIPAVSRRY